MGHFESGTFRAVGPLVSGTFRDGTFQDGTFSVGTFSDGTFCMFPVLYTPGLVLESFGSTLNNK
jgi:hypothetical protein